MEHVGKESKLMILIRKLMTLVLKSGVKYCYRKPNVQGCFSSDVMDVWGIVYVKHGICIAAACVHVCNHASHMNWSTNIRCVVFWWTHM